MRVDFTVEELEDVERVLIWHIKTGESIWPKYNETDKRRLVWEEEREAIQAIVDKIQNRFAQPYYIDGA